MDWIATIVSIPAILAAVNIFKQYGLPSEWAPIMSIVVGAVMAAGASYIQMGSFDNVAAALLIGVITGLSASGVYDVTKQPDVIEEQPETTLVPETGGSENQGAF